MKIAEQLKAFQTVLGKWAGKLGGSCRIAGDRSQLVGILSQAPGAPRVVLVFINEVPRGEMDAAEESRVDRELWAILSRGRGFKADSGDSLTEGSGGGKPMFDLAEEARDLIRTTMLDPERNERLIYYKGIYQFEMAEELKTDAVYISFGIGTDIGMVTVDSGE